MVTTMKRKRKGIRLSPGRIIFNICNYTLLSMFVVVSILLLLHIIALSMSDNASILANKVVFLPKGFNLEAYKLVLKDSVFWNSFWVSVKRVFLGIVINMFLNITIAYPLSKTKKEFKARNFFMIFFFITAIFSGGIVPQFVLLSNLKMINTIWALVMPTAVSFFNIVILMNFFRRLPKEMIEAAQIDGANELQILIRIILPCSVSSLATILLFTIVGHWNSWFDGLVFNTSINNYPLQSYLQTIIIENNFSTSGISDASMVERLSSTSLRCAEIIIGLVPILLIYPFLQPFFMDGLVVGSVKE